MIANGTMQRSETWPLPEVARINCVLQVGQYAEEAVGYGSTNYELVENSPPLSRARIVHTGKGLM